MKVKILDIIIFIVAVTTCMLFFLFPYKNSNKKLFLLANNKEIELPYKDGIIDLEKYFNVNVVIEIKDYKVKVINSDCSDKICVNFGEISECNQSIVCLPNKIAIKIDCSDDR